ncbi:MAG: alpha/beta hydrolase [Bacteroidales bacterium]
MERNEFGTGDTSVIMLHGNSLDPTIFAPLIDELENKFKLITLNLPGHGNSERPNNYNIQNLSQVIIDTINNETGKKYILAHSLSGHLILQGLLQLKDVSGIICVGTPPLNTLADTVTAFTRLGKLMNNAEWSANEEKEIIEGLSKDSYELIKEIIRKSDPNFRKAITTSAFLEGFTSEIENLNKTQIPVSLVFSTNDDYIDTSYCHQLPGTIENPYIKIIFIDYGGHLPFFNFPEKFSRIIQNATEL